MGTFCVKHSGKTGCEIWHQGPLGLVLPLGHDVRPCCVRAGWVAMDTILATERPCGQTNHYYVATTFAHATCW